MKTSQQLISEMSKSEIRELESRLSVIIEHLLKIKHVKGQIGTDNLRGWKKSVRDQQNDVADHLEENPGLKPKITDALLDTVYRSVVGGLNKDYPNVRFPRSRQLSLEEIVRNDGMAILRKR